MTPVLNGWVLGAYTAMLGRLSAATAALEATEVPNIPTDSDSESEHSSYTEKYVKKKNTPPPSIQIQTKVSSRRERVVRVVPKKGRRKELKESGATDSRATD